MLRFEEAVLTPELPEQTAKVPFDFYLDDWSPAAAQLQETGDLILVRLPYGFYGGIVVHRYDTWAGLVDHFYTTRPH